MELVDVLDKNGNKLNETIDKDKAHLEGIYHPVVHIAVVSKDRDKILVQKRCANKKIFPNTWDMAAAGHVDAGEEYLVAAKREFEEELGLNSEDYEFNFMGVFDEKCDLDIYKVREFAYVYVIFANIDIKDIKLQKEEVSEIKWISRELLKEMVDAKEIIVHAYYDDLLEITNKYFRFKEFNNDEVLSFYSKKPFDFNFKAPRDEYFKIVENDLNYHFKKIKGSTYQAHGDEVVIVDENNLEDEIKDVDGLLTNLKGVALEIRTADCQSIFLYDPVKKVVGNIHSGWKGTYKQIIVAAINKMIEHYKCNKEDILVGFNPSILGCCFEVKDDVIDLFSEICDVSKYSKKYEGRYLLDTVSINYDRLIEMGIKKEHIFLSEICTGCKTLEYHSYRKENKTEGRNISIICLK